MNPPGTLVETAKREAEEAEQQIAEEQLEQDVSLLGGVKEDPEPGEDDDPDAPSVEEYSPKEPTKDELRSAMDILQEMRSRVQDFGPERTIESLIAIVDVVPAFTCPMEWQGEKDDEYREATIITEIAGLLLRGCAIRLPISLGHVVCLWRNKEKWVDSAGNNIRSKAATFNQRTRFMTEGTRAAIEVNFHLFKTMNPTQKVFTVYRALRQLDEDGKRVAPDFSGYLDELEYFGPRVFREHVALAASVQHGLERELPFQLSLLDLPDED